MTVSAPSSTAFSVFGALERALRTLLPVRDIIEQRVDDAIEPAWCRARGWGGFLLALSDADLQRCESEGLAVAAGSLPGVPRDLSDLCAQVRAATALPALEPAPPGLSAAQDFRGVSWRKREQLSALLGALAPLVAHAERIVDVGAGSGHFTRLSARHFSREALGLERNPERVASALAREEAAPAAPFNAQFAVVDAFREGLALRAGDLAIGLHACGELGDALVSAVVSAGVDLGLVSCCLQKISTPQRHASSLAARGLSLPKETLGLSNLTAQAVGVEASMEHMMRARQARYALRQLLSARGLAVEPGAEMSGINRRQASAGLAEIAARALAQRGLPAATASEIAHHEQAAIAGYGAVRRLSLPRNLLARSIELAVVLDRAAHLMEQGYAVVVATLFDRAVTPRNISLFASRDASRLPTVRALPS